MGLVDVIKRIKGFFNKKSKVKQTDSKDIANSVIKEYLELSEDEKIRVDNFLKEIDLEYHIFDERLNSTINICIRGIEVEEGLIRNFIYPNPRVNKIITIMDGEAVAVRYVIPLDDTDYSENIPLEYAVRNKIIKEIMHLLEEYKSKKNSSVSVLSKKG